MLPAYVVNTMFAEATTQFETATPTTNTTPDPQPTPENNTTHTWGVWNVTNPNDEYSVIEGLSEEEAKDLAQTLTDNPEKVYIDPETGVEHDGIFEARESYNDTDTVQTPLQRPNKDTLFSR